MSDLEARLEAVLRRSEPLMHVLRTLAELDLPDWLIFSGAIYQRVFNDLTGRPLDYGIKDYDVAYYDASDISYEAEDGVIRRVAAVFEPPLREMVEVRNQARVHVWFEGHFHEPYAPLESSVEALERFVSPVFAVGVRLDGQDRMTIHLRANPHRTSPNFGKIAASARARWPEIAVIAP